MSLRSSFNVFNEEVVMTDLCAEATEGDDDKGVLIDVAGAFEGAICLRRFSSCLPDKMYLGGSDFVPMNVLEAKL